MKPLICFYKEDQLWSSNNYLLLTNNRSDIFDFLKQIRQEYPQDVKILQIDFDCQNAHVFVLRDSQLISKSSLASDLKSPALQFKSAISHDEFIKKINFIKKDIQKGRYYQVNFTSRFSALQKTEISSWELFKYYFLRFQSPYSAYLPLDHSDILCFSPELFLEKKGPALRTCPIKGTSRQTESFDTLIKDQKENAELSMIVDLLRNDLQSVCSRKISVDQHRAQMSLNYVTHTFSQISGSTHMQLPQILKNMLPAGSISGCPKKESVLAINELEDLPRGFYTGCIGWWKDDDFTLNLAIRSFEYRDQYLTYFSGCGIVYDSDPEKEWLEFHHKARHLEVHHGSQ